LTCSPEFTEKNFSGSIKNSMFAEFEHKVWEGIREMAPTAHKFLWPRRRVVKYVVSGGTAAAANLLLLFFFTDILNIWYVISAVLAFSIAFVISFIFQKFWTFEDRSTDGVHVQAVAYLVVALINLCLNTFLIYCFVEFFSIHYLVAQIISGILIACESFFVYRRFIFKNIQSN